jgi:hypothetical protein
MIRFLAEIALRSEALIQPTPSNGIARVNNIYEVDMSPPPAESYWLDWGGWYDEYTGTQIELYYGQFLQHVNSQAELLQTPFSLWIDTATYFAYINIPKHPWLYPDYAAEGENVVPFISSALNPDNPSNNFIRGVLAETRLAVPSFTVKISESVSGIALNQGFSVDLDNHDGYFDDNGVWDLFNTPVHLKKTTVENPAYEDFKEIRGGYAGSTRTTFDRFSIEVEDKLRSMSEPVCGVIQQADFPGYALIDDAIGKNIPVVYGMKKIKLIKIDDSNHYVAAEYISQTPAPIVYDKDGNVIGYALSGNILTAINADTALITGYTANTAGKIIKDIVIRKTGLQYNDSNWNDGEINKYIAISPRVNISFTSGDIKKAVQDTLKSDMAYFIQQTDGRFTIRKWGEIYNSHIIPAWTVTQNPEKDYAKAHENYFSSCVVKYNFIETDRNTFDLYLYTDEENAAENRYRKRRLRENIETDLITEADARSLAVLLGSRYTAMRPSLKQAVGVDTTAMELLDNVIFDGDINGRQFSAESNFVITEINPAQDILTLEDTGILDLDEMTARFNNADYEEDYDQMFADTDNGEYEILVDGGDI